MNWTRRGFLSSLAAAPFLAQGASLLADEKSDKTPESAVEEKRLAFRDGRFKILQLTDLHLHFDEAERMRKSNETLGVVRKLLADVKPDLAILTGDLVTADPTGLSGGLPEAWMKLAEPFAEASVPFAITFGNHDHERVTSAAEQLTMIQASAWNLTRSDEQTLPGAGNCTFPICGTDGRPRRRIWLFDSHSVPSQPNFKKLSHYDWIKSEQIQWYRKESEKLESENLEKGSGLAFFHIPLPEYWEIHRAEGMVGHANEDVCAPDLNSGLFTAFVERENIGGVFVGHDHINDYIGRYKGIALAYGLKTKVGTNVDPTCGGRVIELEEENAGFKTHLVTDGGDRLFDYTFTPEQS